MTKIQEEMKKFVEVWTKAGKPITKDWYEAFMKHTCPNIESPNACQTGYCPMGDDDCCLLINEFS